MRKSFTTLETDQKTFRVSFEGGKGFQVSFEGVNPNRCGIFGLLIMRGGMESTLRETIDC